MRFVRFNAVGVVGFLLQMAVLWLLVRAGVHYLLATALAVECAVLHNFLWHERWTWKDRPVTGRVRLGRLARFHALNGMVSLVGNLMLMRGLVGVLGMPVLTANLIAVSICALVNFAASERAVFQADCKGRRERAPRASHANGASRRSGERERVSGSLRGEAPQIKDAAIRVADRRVTATKVNVPFVHPAVGSVVEPTTNRLS